MQAEPSTNGQAMRHHISSISPLKRMRQKENQIGRTSPTRLVAKELLKRRLPLGSFVSAANIMCVLPQLEGGGVLVREKSFGAVDSTGVGVGGRGKRKRCSGGGTPEKRSVASAVERRNARERNRVQQVNNGFAALRQIIPDEIAEAFEAGTIARGGHKKLSKVETLRMAVEYIRSLERLLACSDSGLPDSPEQATHRSLLDGSIKRESQLPATPPPEPTGPAANFFLAIKPRAIVGLTPASAVTEGVAAAAGFDQTQITIINGHQYVRIPGTNTFQYLDPESLHGHQDRESSAGLDFSEDSGTPRQQLLMEYNDEEDEEENDEDDEENEEEEEEQEVDALSPQSNFTPDPDAKRDVELFAPAGEELAFDQQQYDELMLIKSGLEDEADLTEDPEFINWIETSQQQQQLQQHQSFLD